jgi:hypothetical protein
VRNAELNELMPFLASQHESKYDVVVPSTHLGYYEGQVVVTEGRTIFDDDGVGLGTATLNPTREFESQLAERLDVPARYIEKMRGAEVLDLLDSNVNEWMRRSEKNWFVRGFLDWQSDHGIARAFLSDRYAMIDHIDAVTATLDGIVAAGIDPAGLEVSGDLSASRLRLKIVAPEITAQAPAFLRAYRNPTTGDGGDDAIQAGAVLTNSETGMGAHQLAPQITVRVCKNGMTRTVDALRHVHLGKTLEAGRIAWSADTQRANIALIREQAKDAITAFLSTDYLEQVAQELDEQGSKMLDRPVEVIEKIGSSLGYTKDEQQTILNLFTRGGDTSSGGVVNAFTALARDTEDPARAMEIEEEAFAILALAAQS